MKHGVGLRKLGRATAARGALLRNLCQQLLEHGRLRTTLQKAKELRRVAERCVTWGKRGTLHARRRAARVLYTKEAVRSLFEEWAPLYAERAGGYTRIVRLPPRKGDNASTAFIEFIDREGELYPARPARPAGGAGAGLLPPAARAALDEPAS